MFAPPPTDRDCGPTSAGFVESSFNNNNLPNLGEVILKSKEDKTGGKDSLQRKDKSENWNERFPKVHPMSFPELCWNVLYPYREFVFLNCGEFPLTVFPPFSFSISHFGEFPDLCLYRRPKFTNLFRYI